MVAELPSSLERGAAVGGRPLKAGIIGAGRIGITHLAILGWTIGCGCHMRM